MTENFNISKTDSSADQNHRPINIGFLSTFILKLIAIASMTIDHIALGLGTLYNKEKDSYSLTGLMSYDTYELCRIIGRLAFPIFCYLIAQGLLYTRDVKRYAARLLVFALISQVPFSLMSKKLPFDILGGINVYFTLFIGLVVIAAIKYLKGLETQSNRPLLYAGYFLIALTGAGIADLIGTDYGSFGVILILVFYLLNHKPLICCAVACCLIIFGSGGIESYAAFALIPIMLHNHQRGPSMKYFFYAYYPAHMLVIYILYTAMVG